MCWQHALKAEIYRKDHKNQKGSCQSSHSNIEDNVIELQIEEPIFDRNELLPGQNIENDRNEVPEPNEPNIDDMIQRALQNPVWESYVKKKDLKTLKEGNVSENIIQAYFKCLTLKHQNNIPKKRIIFKEASYYTKQFRDMYKHVDTLIDRTGNKTSRYNGSIERRILDYKSKDMFVIPIELSYDRIKYWNFVVGTYSTKQLQICDPTGRKDENVLTNFAIWAKDWEVQYAGMYTLQNKEDYVDSGILGCDVVQYILDKNENSQWDPPMTNIPQFRRQILQELVQFTDN